jgi:hypothetical protein
MPALGDYHWELYKHLGGRTQTEENIVHPTMAATPSGNKLLAQVVKKGS